MKVNSLEFYKYIAEKDRCYFQPDFLGELKYCNKCNSLNICTKNFDIMIQHAKKELNKIENLKEILNGN